MLRFSYWPIPIPICWCFVLIPYNTLAVITADKGASGHVTFCQNWDFFLIMVSVVLRLDLPRHIMEETRLPVTGKVTTDSLRFFIFFFVFLFLRNPKWQQWKIWNNYVTCSFEWEVIILTFQRESRRPWPWRWRWTGTRAFPYYWRGRVARKISNYAGRVSFVVNLLSFCKTS